MHLKLLSTEYQHRGGAISHTALRLADGSETVFGVCPGTEEIGAFVRARLAEHPGPRAGWNTYEIAHREVKILAD